MDGKDYYTRKINGFEIGCFRQCYFLGDDMFLRPVATLQQADPSVPISGNDQEYSRLVVTPGIGMGYLPSGPACNGAGPSVISRSTVGANS